MLNFRANLLQKLSDVFAKLKSCLQPKPWQWVLPIKGSFYYDAELAEAAGWLMIGRELQLRCEPDNPYDSQAVQIFLPLVHRRQPALIGYIPYSHSRALTWLLNDSHRSASFDVKLFNGYRQYQRLHLFICIQARLTLWQRLRLSMLKRPNRQIKNR